MNSAKCLVIFGVEMMKSDSKYKYLAENTALFAISSFLSKFISFLMVPLYTGVLTTYEYGVADLIATTVTLLLPILTLSVIEAVMRFSLTDEEDKASIFSSTLVAIIFSIILCFLLKPLIVRISIDLNKYFIYFWFLFATTTFEQMFFKFCKGLEKVKICAFNALIVVLTTVLLNILFLVVFKFGIYGYLTAMILSKLVSSVYLFCAGRLWEYISIRKIDKKLLKGMLKYSIPLIPTTVAWWVNTTADRYIIIAMVGTAANGLYSAGNKLPSLLSIFTGIFLQAWQISGVKEFDEDDYSAFYSNIYCAYVAIMTVGCSFIILISPIISKILFQKSFYSAWVFTPYLLIGTVFSGLCGILATPFNASKNNSSLVISTGAGAVINIVLNFFMIKRMGAIGAAIATAISFVTVWVIRYYTAQKICRFNGNFKKNIIIFMLLFVQAIYMSCEFQQMYIVSAVICCIIVFLNRELLFQGLNLIMKKIFKKKRGS